jgi:hypothetical protein
LVSEFVKRKDDASKTKMKGALIKWLQAENGEPIARNYAAYTLGMLGVSDAADALAKAARTDLGLDVKLYCITSLGKIRARKHRGLLVELYDEEPELRRKTTIGQALCRMVGLIDYEL